HVADLVAEDVGQHVVIEPEVEHAGGDEDLAARQREGVGHRHLDDAEGEGELLVLGMLRQLVADAVDARELLRVVRRAVLGDGLGGGLEALVEEVGIGDALRPYGPRGGEHQQEDQGGGENASDTHQASPRNASELTASGGDRKSTRLNSSHANISY